MLAGDFNEVLSSDNKFGGLLVNLRRSNLFNKCLNACGMIDLGFHGPHFTWSNLKGIQCSLATRPSNFLVVLEKKLRLEYLGVLQ